MVLRTRTLLAAILTVLLAVTAASVSAGSAAADPAVAPAEESETPGAPADGVEEDTESEETEPVEVEPETPATTPAPESEVTSAPEAEQPEPESPEATDPAPDRTDRGILGRTADRGGCSSGIRWLGRCAITGYVLPRKCGAAWCGVLGTLARKKKRFYRADPRAGNRPGGYKKTKKTQKSKGKGKRCGFGKRRGRSAAFVLSKYGARSNPNQRAAAVDLAITHLLCGKRWRIGAKMTNRRLKMARNVGPAKRKKIKRVARKIVREAKRQRGPYRMRLRSTEASAGEPLTVTARLRSSAGRPATNRRLVLRLPDGSKTDAFTNSRGVARWTFKMSAGTSKLVVRAPRLEHHKLFLKKPKRKRASRLLVAGKHRSMARRITVTTKKVPKLSVSASGAQIPRPLRATMRYTESLGSHGRRVTVRLRGPGGAGMGCGGNVVSSTRWTLSANGTYRLPRPGGSWAPKTGNRYYRWQVSVAGDALNTPKSVCSKPVQMKKADPVIKKSEMRPESSAAFNKGQRIKPARFRYRGGYGSGRRNVKTRVWGPFSSKVATSCSAGKIKIARQKKWGIKGNGQYGLIKPGSRVRLRQSGWYKFQVIVGGNRSNATAKRCGPAFRVR